MPTFTKLTSFFPVPAPKICSKAGWQVARMLLWADTSPSTIMKVTSVGRWEEGRRSFVRSILKQGGLEWTKAVWKDINVWCFYLPINRFTITHHPMGMVSRLGQIGIHDHRIVQRHTFLQFGLVWFMTTGWFGLVWLRLSGYDPRTWALN